MTMTKPKSTPNGKAPAAPTQAARFDVPEFMVPKSIAEVRELARLIGLAEWAPDSYRDLDGNYVQQKIELAIMHGATVGLGPIAAVQSIAVIDGMPTIWGDGALSIVERSGLLEDMLEEYQSDPEEGLAAICTMRRRRRPTPIQNRFSMAMAEQAQLTRKEGPWQSYPQRMLKMRARSWTIRDGFADVLRGLHIREEVDDFIETGGLWPQLLAAAQEGARGGARPKRAAPPPRTPREPQEGNVAAPTPPPGGGAGGCAVLCRGPPTPPAPIVGGGAPRPPPGRMGGGGGGRPQPARHDHGVPRSNPRRTLSRPRPKRRVAERMASSPDLPTLGHWQRLCPRRRPRYRLNPKPLSWEQKRPYPKPRRCLRHQLNPRPQPHRHRSSRQQRPRASLWPMPTAGSSTSAAPKHCAPSSSGCSSTRTSRPTRSSACGSRTIRRGWRSRGCMAGRYWRRLRSAWKQRGRNERSSGSIGYRRTAMATRCRRRRSRSQWPAG